eukprot:CCRYP_009018-RA/>CCRYP_009018-RA protein AED:0.25 eAED:0.25 QI:0/0/0/1/1/0.5/2/0/1030
MPPRRNTTARKPASPATPSESHPSHPSNLLRSLARNDVEIAALSKLNSALRILRQSIVDEFGEDTLIEIATSTQKKTPPDESSDEGNTDDERLKQLSASFNLRMKLRRRLLNRLARRLHRVAYLMDNGDVSPPQPPSYGDEVIRFKIDEDENVRVVSEEEVKMFVEEEERKEEVKRQIEERRGKRAKESLESNEDLNGAEDTGAAPVTSSADVQPFRNADKAHVAELDLILRGDQEDRSLLNELVEYEVGYDKTTVTDESSAESKVNNTFNPIANTNDDHEVNEEGQFVVEKSSDTQRINFSMNAFNKRTVPPRERSLEWKRWVKELSAKIPHQVTFDDIGVGGDGVVFDLEKRLADAKRKRSEMMEESDSKGIGKVLRRKIAFDHSREEKEGKAGKALRRKSAFDDVGDEVENEVTVPDENRGKGKSSERREMEDSTQGGADEPSGSDGKRKISPHRSSDDDLGFTNMTCEDEAVEVKTIESEEKDADMETGSDHLSVERSEENYEADERPSRGNSDEEASETGDSMFTNEVAKSKKEDLHNEGSVDGGSKRPDEESIKSAGSKQTNHEDNGAAIPDAKPAKRHTRTFSLIPVPSFHAQDLRRVQLIQIDLYQSGEMVNIQRRYDRAQAAYDEAFKKSMELQQAKASAQTEYQKNVERQQVQLNAMKQNANKTVMRAKQLWEHTQQESLQFRRLHGESNFQIRLEAKDTLYGLIDRIAVRESTDESTGTKLTRNEIRHASSSKGELQITRAAVANVLGHIVDSVDRRHKEMLARHNEFIPPCVDTEHSTIIDPNTKETMAQAFKRVQTQLTQRRAKIDKAFADAEKARAAAWADVVKYKAMLGDSAGSKPKSRSRKSSAATKSIAPVAAPVAAPLAAPAVAQQTVPYQPQVFVPVQPSQPSTIPVQMMVSAPLGLAGVSVPTQRTSFKPVVLQSATGSAFSAPKVAAKESQPVNQGQSEGETKTTQQSKYAYGDRYSLQNVAARKLNDGTVVPVTQPKKLPNGEYARPIGRQRKGMEWDSIRGVWIPEG